MAKAANKGQSTESINKAVEDNAPDEVNVSPSTAKKGGARVEKKVVTVADGYKTAVEYINKGMTLVFDPSDFLELPQSVVDDMNEASRENYYFARSQRAEYTEKSFAEKRRESYDREQAIQTISGNSKGRLERKARDAGRPRKGYHHTWLTPEDFDDWAQEAGYKVVRGKKDKDGNEGSAVRVGPEDKPELLLCEIPEERYKAHVEAVSAKSKARSKGQKAQFENRIEDINKQADLTGDRKLSVSDA